ncbi:hypothetical protein Tco_1565237, partial [Tanacetum coccineum]
VRETSAAKRIKQMPSIHAISQQKIQLLVAWSTTQSHFGFSSDLSDAEENPEETADVEQAFNNLSTMSFLNISTRSKTTQTAKRNTKTIAKRLEDLQKENN